MDEVSGAVIGVALVLCAVFVPTAFSTGITGQFFRQFARTIAVSTVISALNSLTLSAALGAILLKPHGAEKDRFQKLIDALFGWFSAASTACLPGRRTLTATPSAGWSAWLP